MAGLAPALIETMHAAARAIRDGQPAIALQRLHGVLDAAPGHPEALRLLGILHLHARRADLAVEALTRATAARPDDATTRSDLASAQSAAGDVDAALHSWRRACVLAPTQALAWFNLGRNLQLQGETVEAVDALERACTLAPELLPATILLGDALVHLGRFDDAQTRYRAALRLHPACGDAWRGLSNIKTRPLGEDDHRALTALLQRAELDDGDRIAIGFALGKLQEDRARYPQAFAAIADANARMSRRAHWSVQAFERFIHDALRASQALPAPLDPELGREAVFVVGVPRSGTTLLEQILATHPDVEGAGELPDLGIVIQRESQRLRMPYPAWSATASAHDWQRLGHEYLQRTARWRARRPRFVDKMPENWKHAGVLRAMLPGATVIHARRDALETGWSCFRQQFYQLPHFACELADIGACLRGCERAMDIWRERDPARIHPLQYEQLLCEPEAQIRCLLDACALAFDPACLDFHRGDRSVRSASAAQVREPLRADTRRAERYGPLLDPLRHALCP